MASEGNYVQDYKENQKSYQGSMKTYFLGSTIGSGAAFSFIDFSGTNTGFGTANSVLCNHLEIKASGGALVSWKFVSGASTPIDGELLNTENIQLNGISRSGLWIRSDTTNTKIRIWAW